MPKTQTDRTELGKPKLRQVQPQWTQYNGNNFLTLRDPLALSNNTVLVPDTMASIIPLLDGSRDIGGLQSTSRSCMARLSNISDQSKMFGIYGLSGKITAFLGPYFVALLTTTFNNQKAGFISIIIFFILGYLIIRNLKLPNYSNSK